MVKFNEDGIWTVTLHEVLVDSRNALGAIGREHRYALRRKKIAKTPEQKRYWAGKANGLNEGYQWLRQAIIMMEHQEVH